MITRVFKNKDGSLIFSSISKVFDGSTFVDDETKPLYIEVEDRDSPIYGERVVQSEKLLDGTVIEKKEKIVIGYNKKTIQQGYEKRALTVEECKFPTFCDGLEYIDIDSSEMPKIDSASGNYVEQFYCDGDLKKENIKQDSSWEKRLMPCCLVKSKEIKYQKSIIDEELSKYSPDQLKIISAQRAAEKVKELDDDADEAKIYEMALENLSRAESKKPEIEAKLKEKIGK